MTRAISSHELDAVPEVTRLATGERGGLPGVQSEADAPPSPDELRDDQVDGPELSARLAKTWGTDKGLIGTLSTVDHKISLHSALKPSVHAAGTPPSLI